MTVTHAQPSRLTSDIATLDTLRVIKVSMAWITILYVLCFAVVALFPDVRSLLMQYTLHADVSMGQSVITWQTFLAGLVFWNIVTAVGFGLFAVLFNRMK